MPIVAWNFEREQRTGLVGDRLLRARLPRFLVVLVERLDRVAQDLGIADEVVVDERAELLLLRRREFVGARRQGGRQRGAGEGGGEAEGGETGSCQTPGFGSARIRAPGVIGRP